MVGLLYCALVFLLGYNVKNKWKYWNLTIASIDPMKLKMFMLLCSWHFLGFHSPQCTFFPSYIRDNCHIYRWFKVLNMKIILENAPFIPPSSSPSFFMLVTLLLLLFLPFPSFSLSCETCFILTRPFDEGVYKARISLLVNNYCAFLYRWVFCVAWGFRWSLFLSDWYKWLPPMWHLFCQRLKQRKG